MSADKNKVFRLLGKVQHYSWGGISYLPGLLKMSNPDEKPFAEYWMGAHEQASAEILFQDQNKTSLRQYIRDHPDETIGDKVAKRFGQLPYLLKLLDVRDMLSIQVHPNKRDAEKEFEFEHRSGIGIQDPKRNYKDENHKPELMLALSEFWLLHGFKKASMMLESLNKIPEFSALSSVFSQTGYQGLYQLAMEMRQERVNEILAPLLARIIPAYQQGKLHKTTADFWAARAALTFNQGNQIDRGIFSIYFFNLLNLHPGEAIFQDAGLPHAYLEGQNIEIMANSDNVLRGGLTSKHIDVKELMKHVRFEETIPDVIHGNQISPHELVYSTPAPDFELSMISLDPGEKYAIRSNTTEIFLLTAGEMEIIESESNHFICREGQSFICFNHASLNLSALKKSLLCKASVPIGGV
jgi:mannose-6-phosphate isomerase